MPTHRERLADQLKQARVNAGYASQAALAKAMHVSRPMVSKAESPTQPVPSDALPIAWADKTGADIEHLTELAEQARGGTPDWFMEYLSAEQEATVLRIWGDSIIPGLFQAESYARWVLAASESPKHLDALVDARISRRKILERDGVHVTGVIAARVFRELIDSPAVMAEQCSLLLAIAERPNVALHIVPDGANVGAWAAIDIASKGPLTTVCMTTGLADVTTTAPDQIDLATRTFDRLLGSALDTRESLDFLRQMESEWKTRL
jgi:hypothetical protein